MPECRYNRCSICAFAKGCEILKENAELKSKIAKIKDYLAYKLPHELMNEATSKIWHMI